MCHVRLSDSATQRALSRASNTKKLYGVQLARVTEKLNGVTDGGRRKLNEVTDGATGKRSAGSHFYPYRTRIGSHSLP